MKKSAQKLEGIQPPKATDKPSEATEPVEKEPVEEAKPVEGKE